MSLEENLDQNADEIAFPENNLVRISLIGTLKDRNGLRENVFTRTLESVPEIDADCFSLEGDKLTQFMQVISSVTGDGPQLELGRFALDDSASAFLNGNRLFQRHAIVVGSTGSGKSYTVARILDQVAQLPQANAILFDVHGEYQTLLGPEYRHLRIAGPGQIGTDRGLHDGILHLPYWLLSYEALLTLFIDRSDQNAPNQAMLMTRCVIDAKRHALHPELHAEILANFTVDSPVPFDLNEVIAKLELINKEMVEGARGGEKQGPYFDKLSRLISRFEAKRNDRRLGFLFQPPDDCMRMEWLEQMSSLLVCGRMGQDDRTGGIKIINFSEVPSDMLPIVATTSPQRSGCLDRRAARA